MKSPVAIIGGTGLTQLPDLNITHKEMVNTPFGPASSPLNFGTIDHREIVFIARHGYMHTIPPHKVNYQANIWALREVGVKRVYAVAAVGGITAEMYPGRIVVPHQIIDYTYGRAMTYFEDDLSEVTHIDFTHPYTESQRQLLISTAQDLGYDPATRAVYAATQGPRLETAAEVSKLERDGSDIVGMTGMPEAALARELDLEYATTGLVVNWAAGKDGDQPITLAAMDKYLKNGMKQIRCLLAEAISKEQ